MAELLSRDNADVGNFRFLPRYARSLQSIVLTAVKPPCMWLKGGAHAPCAPPP